MTADTGAVTPLHPSDIKIFDHQQKVVVLRPSIPTWVTLTPEGFSLLTLCTGTLTVQEIAEKLNVNCEAVQQCIQSLQEHNLLGEEEPVKAPSKALHNIWLHVTNACNLACITCYQSSGSAYPHELTVEEIYELLSQGAAFKPQSKPQTLTITGGEPLLRSDLWDICRTGSELHFNLNLLTNGTLITGKRAQKIAAHFDDVQVSLDGMQKTNDAIRGRGSFEQIVSGISTLMDAGIVPSVAIVATKLNLEDIPALLTFLKDLGVTNVRVRPVIYQGRANRSHVAITNAEYESLITRIYEKGYSTDSDLLKVERFAGDIRFPKKNARGCSAGWYAVSIAATGEVYPCIAGHIPHFQLGSIREQSFKTIWNSNRLKMWRSFNVNTSAHCSTCEWRNFCGGGCKVNAFLRCGQIDGGDHYCEAFKNLYHRTLLWEAVYD